MTLVRIIKEWTSPDLMRQTSGKSGRWDGIQFTLEPVEKCDYVIVLNNAPKDTVAEVTCPPDNVWAVIQEPPNEYFRHMHRGIVAYRRIYNQDPELKGRRYILSQPALPWHIGKDFDFLCAAGIPPKERELSWITSNAAIFSGHRDRMRFLELIRGKIEFDLFGKGFASIQDKWDGLAPYRYSVAVENFRNPHYWSEKIADCFLSWTMPVYCGCSRIADYFPPESMILIDIDDPKAVERIREGIADDLWGKNLDAISAARELVLKKYQFFPFIADKIRQQGRSGQPRKILLRGGYYGPPPPLFSALAGKLARTAGQLQRLLHG